MPQSLLAHRCISVHVLRFETYSLSACCCLGVQGRHRIWCCAWQLLDARCTRWRHEPGKSMSLDACVYFYGQSYCDLDRTCLQGCAQEFCEGDCSHRRTCQTIIMHSHTCPSSLQIGCLSILSVFLCFLQIIREQFVALYNQPIIENLAAQMQEHFGDPKYVDVWQSLCLCENEPRVLCTQNVLPLRRQLWSGLGNGTFCPSSSVGHLLCSCLLPFSWIWNCLHLLFWTVCDFLSGSHAAFFSFLVGSVFISLVSWRSCLLWFLVFCWQYALEGGCLHEFSQAR